MSDSPDSTTRATAAREPRDAAPFHPALCRCAECVAYYDDLPSPPDKEPPVSVESERLDALSWALDLLDQYDERLASYDGRDRVFTPVHVAGKNAARAALVGNVDAARWWRDEIVRRSAGFPPQGYPGTSEARNV